MTVYPVTRRYYFWIKELGRSHMLRVMSQSKIIQLSKAEAEYVFAAEKYLNTKARRILPFKQAAIIDNLYAKHVAE